MSFVRLMSSPNRSNSHRKTKRNASDANADPAQIVQLVPAVANPIKRTAQPARAGVNVDVQRLVRLPKVPRCYVVRCFSRLPVAVNAAIARAGLALWAA